MARHGLPETRDRGLADQREGGRVRLVVGRQPVGGNRHTGIGENGGQFGFRRNTIEFGHTTS